MIIFLCYQYKDINESSYSWFGKYLDKVTDTSPYLRISAKCEIIKRECFKGLNTLISFAFEENPKLTTIESESFMGCKNLSSVDLSSCLNLKTISYKIFSLCENILEIVLPKGLISIHDRAFECNYLVRNVIIPASVNTISQFAFRHCDHLENVVFEDGSNLTSIERRTFANTGVTIFEIPEKVTQIHGDAFNSAQLTNLTIHPKNKHLIIENNNSVFLRIKVFYSLFVTEFSKHIIFQIQSQL